jgi:hypothetical protein
MCAVGTQRAVGLAGIQLSVSRCQFADYVLQIHRRHGQGAQVAIICAIEVRSIYTLLELRRSAFFVIR